jgi:mitochondrial fission protein ELM1
MTAARSSGILFAEPPAGPQPAEISPSADRTTPRVWLILSEKTGDNLQVLAVADSLPWPCETKRIQVRERYVLGKPKVVPSLHHVDRQRSDPLEPPWPDLVVAVGRRMSMVALWIKEQSGGRTRIALIGAPKGRVDQFDLAVVSDQYRYPARCNLLQIRYPLQRIERGAIATEAAAWRRELAALPRPLVAVMIGGLTKEVRFDEATSTRLARDLAALDARLQGTLFVTTSRRTPAHAVAALRAALPAGAILHEWRPGGERNPYRALLGLADLFVVTSDSLSMQMEIARLGRKLAIYALPPSSWLTAGPLSALTAGLLGSRFAPGNFARTCEERLGRALDRIGAMRHHRDLTAIPRRLVAEGHAVWFGQPFPDIAVPPPDELPGVVDRLVALAAH